MRTGGENDDLINDLSGIFEVDEFYFVNFRGNFAAEDNEAAREFGRKLS